MYKFILGFFSATVLITSSYGFVSYAFNDHHSDENSYPYMNSKYQGTWSGVFTNPKLDKDRPDLFDLAKPEMPDSFPFITVSVANPVESLTRNDIERVCVTPSEGSDDSPSFYTVDIYLTLKAKQRVGNALHGHDNQLSSIRLWGYEINSFYIDDTKAQLFATNNEEEKHYADITFWVDEQATYEGFTLLKMLTGNDALEGCKATDDVENMAGYQDHIAFWRDYKKANSAKK